MKIDLKSRFKNPYFIAALLMSIILPAVGYMGATIQDLTTWESVFNLIKGIVCNPFLLGTVIVSVFNAFVDYSTPGIKDDNFKDLMIEALEEENKELRK